MLYDWIIIVPSLAGAILCSYGHWVRANAVWCIGNIFLIVHNVSIGDMSQATLFCIYEIISLFGVVRWYYIRKSNNRAEDNN